jgi:uncharacterized membrane protein HdeD (DUF308 family)
MDAKATTMPGGRQARPEDPSAWMLILRGAIALLFGVLAILWPGITLLVLVTLFAAYALLGGVVSIVAALKVRRAERRWWLPLLLGIVSVVAGVAALVYPALTALVLVLVMGANALVTGALDIAMAIRLRRVLQGRWLLVLSGVLSVVFGVLVLLVPGAGAVALVWLVSLHATLTGVLLLGLGFRMRRAARSGAAPEPVPAGAP